METGAVNEHRTHTNNAITTNGYTGHDQLDNHNLIHMGGRVYDPSLGRFLSADLFVQSPYNSQSYNRYSYTFNNPLSYTDPTGYMSDMMQYFMNVSYHQSASWQCLSSIFCLADLYNPEEDREEYELDEAQLRKKYLS